MQLFKRIRPKLSKINPDDEFLEPDEEYSFYVGEEKKIKQAEEEIL